MSLGDATRLFMNFVCTKYQDLSTHSNKSVWAREHGKLSNIRIFIYICIYLLKIVSIADIQQLGYSIYHTANIHGTSCNPKHHYHTKSIDKIPKPLFPKSEKK